MSELACNLDTAIVEESKKMTRDRRRWQVEPWVHGPDPCQGGRGQGRGNYYSIMPLAQGASSIKQICSEGERGSEQGDGSSSAC